MSIASESSLVSKKKTFSPVTGPASAVCPDGSFLHPHKSSRTAAVTAASLINILLLSIYINPLSFVQLT